MQEAVFDESNSALHPAENQKERANKEKRKEKKKLRRRRETERRGREYA